MDLEKLIDQLAKLESSMSGLLEADPGVNKEYLPPFQARSDLHTVSELSRISAEDAQTPSLVLMQLSDFFLAGILLQRRAWRGDSAWTMTEYISQGQHRKLPPLKQADLSGLVKGLSPSLTTTTVKRTSAAALLARLPVQLNIPSAETFAYLMVPTNEVAYIWFSQTPALWSEDQMRHALRLINQAFTP